MSEESEDSQSMERYVQTFEKPFIDEKVRALSISTKFNTKDHKVLNSFTEGLVHEVQARYPKYLDIIKSGKDKYEHTLFKSLKKHIQKQFDEPKSEGKKYYNTRASARKQSSDFNASQVKQIEI